MSEPRVITFREALREAMIEEMERDPINILGQRMQTLGIATQERLKQIDDEAKATVQDAVAFAEDSPPPAPESVHEHVYV